MSLLAETKEMKEELEKAIEAEASEPEEEVDEEAIEPESEEAEEPAVEEEKPEEPKEEKLDDAGYARLRRERAAEKKRADALAEENAALKASKTTEEAETEAPQVTNELEAIINDHRMTRAEREFNRYEAEFGASVKDYDAVSREYAIAVAQSIKIQNPRLSNIEVAERTKHTILIKAGEYERGGFNPIEELYHEAKSLGFTGKSFAKAEEAKEAKPSMAKVAENRKRSAGMTGASGREDGLVSKKTAAEMSPAEWKALPREERARLMSA